MMIDRALELRLAKRRAFICLCIAGLVFIVGLFLPTGAGWGVVKATGEAALVGGLADWFAVVALFRRPLGLPIPHTAVIPRSKDQIADGLAEFVKLRFLEPEALVTLLQRQEPVLSLANWLSTPENARRLGGYAAAMVRHTMDLIDDQRVKAFMADAVRTVAEKIDLSKGLAAALKLLTHEGRHEQLLVDLIGAIQNELDREETRSYIANMVAAYLKDEHAVVEKVLPTTWLSGKAAGAIQTAVLQQLTHIAQMPQSEIRVKVNEAIHKLIENLETDENFLRRGEEIKLQVMANQDFLQYTQDLWTDLRQWILDDLAKGVDESLVSSRVQDIGLWIGGKLSSDAELRQSLEVHLASFVRGLAPELANHLVDHIRDTIRNWDASEMTTQLEQQVGSDLQAIRISGTLVGGLIGAALFLVSHGLALMGIVVL